MGKKNNRNIFGSLVLLLTAGIWGFAFAFQRKAMTGVGPYTFCAARMLLAAVCVYAVALASDFINKGKPKNFGEAKSKEEYRKNTLKGGLLAGLVFTAAAILQQVGIQYTSAGKAGFITTLYIVLVPLISMLFLKKRYGVSVFAAVALAVAALYLLSVTEGFRIEKGDSIVMLCALFFALQIIFIDMYANRADCLRISAMQMAICALVSAVLMLIFEHPQWAYIKEAAVAILYCGICSGGIGYTLQIIGQKYTEPAAASLLMSLESVFAVIGGALVLHETMSTKEIIGCVLMFAAVILVQLPGSSVRKGKEKKNG